MPEKRALYSVYDYGGLLFDRIRSDAYAQALRQEVRPGSVVVDIGTGAGMFALLACQFGARKVYAIEPDEAIQVAREMAAANGYGDRVEFFQDVSTRVDLPEQADVIVSDLRGLLPLFGRHLPSITDARRRFLAPGGRLIPRRDTLWAAVVQAPDLYCRHVDPWDDNGYGLDMQAARRFAVNTWRRGPVTPEQLLVEPKRWATLDYATVEDPDVNAPAAWVMERP